MRPETEWRSSGRTKTEVSGSDFFTGCHRSGTSKSAPPGTESGLPDLPMERRYLERHKLRAHARRCLRRRSANGVRLGAADHRRLTNDAPSASQADGALDYVVSRQAVLAIQRLVGCRSAEPFDADNVASTADPTPPGHRVRKVPRARAAARGTLAQERNALRRA